MLLLSVVMHSLIFSAVGQYCCIYFVIISLCADVLAFNKGFYFLIIFKRIHLHRKKKSG